MLKAPWRRLGAWLVDWLCVSLWVGILFAIGIPLSQSGALDGLGLVGLNLFSAIVLVVPVTIVLAVFESRGRTPGKRALGLRVTDAASGGLVPFPRALARNALKIALPWTIGHIAVYGFASAGSNTPSWVFVVTVLAYVLPVVYLIALFVRSGRTPYDVLARTVVIHTTTKGAVMTRPIPEYTVADLEYLNAVEFPSLTNDEAVALGLVAVEVIREWDLSLAVDIVIGDDLVFRAKLKNTNAGNDQWLKGKAATATHFGEPSLLVKARHLEAGTDFTDLDLDHETMKAHGGSIPLRVDGKIVGTLTMSGEPDATDHEAAAEAIERYLGAPDGKHEA